MSSEHPIVILLEDCPTTALIVERAIMLEIPNVRLLWARTVAEAAARAEGLQVDLFLVDIGLPDGNGIDFLWRMGVAHPNARAIVMTASPLPEYRLHTTALGVLHFLEKPVKMGPLVEKLRAALDSDAAGARRNDFRASLENLTPADIIQLKCLTRATTVVEFVSEEQVGRIRFEDGEITDASMGVLIGVEAVYEIIGWKQGQVREHPCVGFPLRTVDCPWHVLLMDAAQRVDERQATCA